MTQKEIKNNLPRLPYWVVNSKAEDPKIIKDDNCDTVCTVDTECGIIVDVAITNGILSAINNTYGKGINPESVPDMFNALQSLHRDLINYGSYKSAEIIQNILKNATL
jgi:hypothetical protein